MKAWILIVIRDDGTPLPVGAFEDDIDAIAEERRWRRQGFTAGVVPVRWVPKGEVWSESKEGI